MRIEEIMNRNVVTSKEEETVTTAAKHMKEAHVGCLVVVDGEKVRGIVTDRDLAVGCLSEGHDPGECPVALHMTSPVTTVSADMDILHAAHMLTEGRIKRLPVVEGERLIGIASFSDIAMAMDQPILDLLVDMRTARRAVHASAVFSELAR